MFEVSSCSIIAINWEATQPAVIAWIGRVEFRGLAKNGQKPTASAMYQLLLVASLGLGSSFIPVVLRGGRELKPILDINEIHRMSLALPASIRRSPSLLLGFSVSHLPINPIECTRNSSHYSAGLRVRVNIFLFLRVGWRGARDRSVVSR